MRVSVPLLAMILTARMRSCAAEGDQGADPDRRRRSSSVCTRTRRRLTLRPLLS